MSVTTCEVCGKRFEGRADTGATPQRYCSKPCRAEAKRERWRKRPLAAVGSWQLAVGSEENAGVTDVTTTERNVS